MRIIELEFELSYSYVTRMQTKNLNEGFYEDTKFRVFFLAELLRIFSKREKKLSF